MTRTTVDFTVASQLCLNSWACLEDGLHKRSTAMDRTHGESRQSQVEPSRQKGPEFGLGGGGVFLCRLCTCLCVWERA